MEKYKYDEGNGLWYELQGDYYIPCLKLSDENQVTIGIWGAAALELSARKQAGSSLRLAAQCMCYNDV